MINIDIYIEKLDILKDYIFAGIDNTGTMVWIDLSALPVAFDLDKWIEIYQQTGYLVLNKEPEYPVSKKLSFEEYYNYIIHDKIISNEQANTTHR